MKKISQVLLKIAENFEELSVLLSEDSQALDKRPQTRSKKVKSQVVAPSTMVWDAYADAFCVRYLQPPPPRNARTNAQLAQLVGLVGCDRAREMAQFYLRSNQSFYTLSRHPIALMVKDQHKLMVDMQLGGSVSRKQASDLEHASTNVDTAKEFLNDDNEEMPF